MPDANTPPLPAIRTVLCALNLSDISAHVLAMAAEVAEAYDAKLLVMHVIEIWDPRYDFMMADLAKQLEKQAQDKLRAELERLGKTSTVPVETIITKGPATLKILQTIRERRPDLIVLGSHGRRGLDRALLGSVTDAVLRVSPTSVLTVRPLKNPDIKTIVCAVDFSSCSRAALERAVELARLEKLPAIKVLNVFEVPLGFMEAGMTYETVLTKLDTVRKNEMDGFLRSVNTAGVVCEPVAMEGPPAATVAQYAERIGADLIVVGSHGRSRLTAFVLGSISTRIIHQAKVPVWAVKAPGYRESLWLALDRL